MKNTFTAIKKALTAAGLDFKAVKLTGDRAGIMVLHDYSGPYPTRDALEKHQAAQRIAEKWGFRAERRGHCTATLIYLDRGGEAATA